MQDKITIQKQFAEGKVTRYDRALQSKAVEWLRFPMSIMVVFIHYYGQELPDLSVLGSCIYDNVRILFSHVVSRGAVPTFFVISGYYFFYNLDFNLTVYKQKLRKRLDTLLVPYVIWNVIMLLSIIGFKLGAFILKGESLYSIVDYLEEKRWLDIFWSCNEWSITSWSGKQIVLTGPVLIPMWFIRDLMVVMVFAPLIYWACKRLGGYFCF